MRLPMARDLEHCPHCGDDNCVKNGNPRGDQRFLCRGCKRTFTPYPKNRATRHHKFAQVKRRLESDELLPQDTVATVDRWVSEAQEHFEWFLRVIAEEGIKAYNQERWSSRQAAAESVKRHPGRPLIEGAYGAYYQALKRDPRLFLKPSEFVVIANVIRSSKWEQQVSEFHSYMETKDNESGWTLTKVFGAPNKKFRLKKITPTRKSPVALNTQRLLIG